MASKLVTQSKKAF